MFEERPEAGTTDLPETDGDDLAATESGDESADSEKVASGVKKVTIPFDEYISLKTDREERNRARATESGVRVTTTDTGTSEAAEQRKRIDDEDALIQRLQLNADAGDEYAKAQLALAKRTAQANRETLYRLEMFDVPEAKRELVKDVMRKRGMQSPFAAYKLVRADDADTLEATVKELRAKLEAKDTPRVKVESTKMRSAVSGPASKGSGPKEVTPQEWIEGMRDTSTRAAFKAAKAKGELVIKAKR